MKTKKKRLIILLLLLLVFSAFLIFRAASLSPTFVYGNLKPKDVSEIEGAVRLVIRARLFPDYSWASIKSLPRSAKTYLGHHIQAVSEQPDGTVQVNVRYRGVGRALHAEIYTVQKGSTGWSVVGSRILVD